MPWSVGDLLFIVVVAMIIYGIMALVNRSRQAHPANIPPVPDPGAGDFMLRSILTEGRTIALVGASPDPDQPSHQIMNYLQAAGYTVWPINPTVSTVLGQPAFGALEELPQSADIVDVFPGSGEIPAIARAAITSGVGTLWLQPGIDSPEGVQAARQAGLKVVVDHCIMQEHQRLLRDRR
ncbi:MAG: CoA-binding protein [Desulfuromonadales bacterium]|nr:CoA-binding protein [Desulfuromonadales bacterium]